ncbi:MAG: deoxyribose-phosphate aldolase [Christensenellales bacterium]
MSNLYPVLSQPTFVPDEMAALLDQSFLRPYFTAKELGAFCEDIIKYNMKVLAVNTMHVEEAAKILRGTDVEIGAAIGFPFGTHPPQVKAMELEYVIDKGAGSYDCVADVGAIKAHDWDRLRRDIEPVVKVGKKYGLKGKSIIESCYLTDEELVQAALIVKEMGMDYVKTSSGYAPGPTVYNTAGTNVHQVSLLKKTVGPDMGVKASGNVTNLQTAMEYLHAGASRLGTSKGVEIIRELMGM